MKKLLFLLIISQFATAYAEQPLLKVGQVIRMKITNPQGWDLPEYGSYSYSFDEGRSYFSLVSREKISEWQKLTVTKNDYFVDFDNAKFKAPLGNYVVGSFRARDMKEFLDTARRNGVQFQFLNEKSQKSSHKKQSTSSTSKKSSESAIDRSGWISN